MKIDVPSYHDSINRMYEKVKKETTNVVDRFNEQEKTRCPFCTKGLSCQLCSMGPCRITEKNLYGACGIDAAGMVMRNFVFKNVLGSAAYTYHAIEAAKTLKATAEGKTPFEIKDGEKLKWFANVFGIDGKDLKEVAIKLADFIISDLGSPNKSKLVEILSLEKRKEVWKKLGIEPEGVFSEILTVGTSAMTNVDSNYLTLAKKSMSMSISTCIAAQFALEMIQDVLFGTPMPHESFADLGILDPNYVNVAVDGHEPFVGMALIKLAEKEEIQEMARKAGAKGLKIIGFIETGQEILQRVKSDVFAGIVGNWIVQEFALATGCIDVFAADMNCALPSLPEYEKYGVKIIPVSRLVRFRGINDGLDYKPEEVEKVAMKLIEIAIENFKRRDKSKAVVIDRKQKILVGFSVEAIERIFGLEVLLNAIKEGKIKGIVALVSCTTLKNGPHDANTVAIAKELIKRDILLISMGCGNAALQVAGLTSLDAKDFAGKNLREICEKLKIPPVLSFGTCTDVGRAAYLLKILSEKLNLDVPQLPVAVTAPEYMEQKATVDAIFAVAYGLATHVSPIPPVTGSEKVVKLLTEEVEKLTGGKVVVEEDPVKAAEVLEKIILEKRRALGI